MGRKILLAQLARRVLCTLPGMLLALLAVQPALAAPIGPQAAYELGAGDHGEPVVKISGANTTVTLPDIRSALAALEPTKTLLEDQGNGVWQANISLLINAGVTLKLAAPTVTWLKLRSQASDIWPGAAPSAGSYNYQSFAYLRTYDGAILIDGVKITSWDPQKNDYDRDISNGRSSIVAKYTAHMDILNANLSYLGYDDDNSWGVSWRDSNSETNPDVLRTRVTGQVLNSTFSYNYYGVYTFQAANMVFRNNTFHHNISYGFDPHDYSHHFLVEDNQSYANGNHGFIISRGCNNFVFRRNKSYNNRYTGSSAGNNAQGFMLDPGALNSQFPQVPSHDNLLEYNQAWGNDGYGLRVRGSDSNTVRFNVFTDNLQGVALDEGSAGNTIAGNTITGSQYYGVYLIGGSDGNTITGNTITRSGRHGIYVKTGGNTITGNTVSDNGTVEGGLTYGSGIAFLREVRAAADTPAPATPSDSQAQVSEVTDNLVAQNIVRRNADEGIDLKNAIKTRVENNQFVGNGANGIYLASGTSQTIVKGNVVSGNREYGIKANGSDVLRNTWTANQVFGNGAGGIVTTSGANGAPAAPAITGQSGSQVSGTAKPGALVEIYSDAGRQGRFFEGSTTAKSDGTFTFTAARPWRAPNRNATATDGQGNSSGFTYSSRTVLPRLYLPRIRR